jgi:plasmid replication initiation protein
VVVESLSELFEKEKQAARVEDSPRKLAPDRHPVRDFFIADILDWALKGDRASLEHPFFSLSKTLDKKTRRYEHNGIKIIITASAEYGRATIWDRDILIYAVSQLVEAINQARPVSRTVRVKAYDLLVATNRHTGGHNYELLVDSFRRLKGTQIETDLLTGGHRERRGFGLLEAWRIVECSPTDRRMVAVELTLSEWLYRAVCAREVLTLNREYFRLNGGLERRLYELARKHCGRQSSWCVALALLHKKSGSSAQLWKFRELIKKTASNNALPEYRLQYDIDPDQVTFTYPKPSAHQGG